MPVVSIGGVEDTELENPPIWVCFRSRRVRKGLVHENIPKVGLFRAQHAQKGTEHENPPILGVSSCSACGLKGVEPKNAPILGARHMQTRNGEHKNAPKVGGFMCLTSMVFCV